MLRGWQTACLSAVKKHYSQSNKHFFCLATPGAGKTVLAAEVAAYLFETKQIEFVICFSPSSEVANGIRMTFAKRLNCNFDGVIGSVGCSYTYQNMRFFNDDYWKLLKNNRVLVVFDEIHHCAGSSIEDANVWGQDIVKNIQQHAAFTLALTGTPWRSDLLPIALATYSDPDNKIICNYTYSLQQAVNDGVCRNPKIVLIDNEEISVTTTKQETKTYNSLKSLLKDPSISYQDLIKHEAVINYIIAQGVSKLATIRQQNSNAAGLIVASSVEHAEQIVMVLTDIFHQSATIVTYKESDAAERISHFRFSNTQWIVSVGMVSEGTDIPRLQVCCHLSRVKTELYFRQVLGRILRVNSSPNQEAWLFTLAEETLTTFANRIDQELPDTCVLIRNNAIANEYFGTEVHKKSGSTRPDNQPIAQIDDLLFSWGLPDQPQIKPREESFLQAFGGFRERVIETFLAG
ncbi:Type III restriction enzyme, res subunit [Pseudoalteromonas sp. P1-13-1a]|uniref:DEAD/DEAH box helicase n=1 Tax=Pseudoalteromonas sp. P1-13-1a TaxID=1723756 RepID=UPI0006D66A80|nr:DEAD/DEAH box helicase family protein [Pseudoalteromonas sp. P1-13-1a]KPZ52766.1 Type III restriction enzyme, res subunit [Pseudoalteromonas sp. P1-13-1a]